MFLFIIGNDSNTSHGESPSRVRWEPVILSLTNGFLPLTEERRVMQLTTDLNRIDQYAAP